jgi:hypothetical protein
MKEGIWFSMNFFIVAVLYSNDWIHAVCYIYAHESHS